jgi:hypothetical protein
VSENEISPSHPVASDRKRRRPDADLACKASGAAVLRDGVYLMPETELCRMTLDAQAKDVCDAGGWLWYSILKSLKVPVSPIFSIVVKILRYCL